MASSSTSRPEIHQRVPTLTGGLNTFAVGDLPAHVDQPLVLDFGRQGIPATVQVSFRPDFSGLGEVPPEIQKGARLTVYATDLSTARVCDYRFQEEVSYWDGLRDRDAWVIDAAKRGKPESPADMPAACERGTIRAARKFDAPFSAPVLQFASFSGRLRMALYAPSPLIQVSVVVKAGTGHVPRGVPEHEDFFSPWRIARMYNVTPENFALVVRWLTKNRTALVLGTVALVNPANGQSLLHVLCGACGDPRLAKLFLCNVSRFISVGHEAHDGSTALHHLLSIPGVCNPRDPRYYRCMELVDLLVTKCAAPLDKQSSDGSTVLHLACRAHRLDSKVLPTLLEAGGGLFLGARDEEGLTAAQAAEDPASGLLPSEVAQALKLLARPVQPLTLRTLPAIDRLPAVADQDEMTGQALSAPCPPEPFERGGGGPGDGPFRLSREKLAAEFRSHDTNKNGWLSPAELRRVYHRYDQFGVVTTDSEMDALVDSLGIAKDGKVTFDEFVLLVLKMTRR